MIRSNRLPQAQPESGARFEAGSCENDTPESSRSRSIAQAVNNFMIATRLSS
jgi:hypothetical protein